MILFREVIKYLIIDDKYDDKLIFLILNLTMNKTYGRNIYLNLEFINALSLNPILTIDTYMFLKRSFKETN